MTGWNLPPGCNVSDIDGPDYPELTAEEIEYENKYWDSMFIEWVLENPDIHTNHISSIELECWFEIACAYEAHQI